MEAFWSKGYEATSLADLTAATGLHKGSLYQAFGDKHSLFVQSLKRYLHAMRRKKNEIIAASKTPGEAIRAVAHAMVDFLDDSPQPMGCMAINALIELAPHDPDVKEISMDHIERMRVSLRDLVEKAQANGEFGTSRSPDLIAALILTMMAGIGTTIKAAINKANAHALIDAQIDAVTAS